MTPREIHTMQDILDALDASPELRREFHLHLVKAVRSDTELRQELRREILTEEVLQLPARFTRMEQDIAEVKDRLIKVEETQSAMVAEQSAMVAEQSAMSAKQSAMSAEQRVMSGRIAHLMGSDYESRAIEQSRRLVRDHLDMLRAVVIHAGRWDSQRIDHDMFVTPALEGRITRGESRQLEEADCIIRCEDENGDAIYAVVEISVTVQDSDCRRAVERADILAKAVGAVAWPFVVGRRDETAGKGVAPATFLQYAPPDRSAD